LPHENANFLVVEDSPTMRQLISFSLKRFKNAKIIEAVDGVDALKKLSGPEKIDLILTDINMPVMDGLKLVSLVRQNAQLKAIPIIIIMGPILYPVAQTFGIDPIHFGTIMIANLGVGFITPPLGVCLYAAMAISGQRLSRVMPFLLPYIVALIASLMVITYVPAFSLWLPRLMVK